MSFLIVKDATRKESYLKVVEKPRSRLLLGHTTNGQICLYLSKQSTIVRVPYFTRQHLHLTECPLILILKPLLDADAKETFDLLDTGHFRTETNTFNIYSDVYYHISPMEVGVSHSRFEHGWISPNAEETHDDIALSKI